MFSFSSRPCNDDNLERSGQAPASRTGACLCVPPAGPPSTPQRPAAEETLLPDTGMILQVGSSLGTTLTGPQMPSGTPFIGHMGSSQE